MNNIFRFEYFFLLYTVLPCLFLIILWRFFYYRPISYAYSLGSYIASLRFGGFLKKYIISFLRSSILVALVLLAAKPQFVDKQTKMPIDGIDIMIALDISGSMDFPDFDKRTRFAVAKEEAIRFIKKRELDAIGLVLFAKYSISRCPLTFDKQLLSSIITPLEIGFIDPDGTVLARGIVAAINRLKNSSSKSKIVILLTDGEPSEGDLDLSVALEIAKKFSIKIYTIGIGSDTEEIIFHPLYGPIKKPVVNKDLLNKIAHETGGKMFMAYNATDMRLIYDTIDTLEKTSYDISLFYATEDLYEYWLVATLFILLLEFILSATYFFAL